MKSLIEFSHVLLHDMGQWCGVSTSRDGKTVAARVEHEGLSFLTIVLPSFSKDFERSLDEGKVADDAFPGFARTRGLPRFLGGFLQLVFDHNSGSLLHTPSINAIAALRQFCLAFAKIELPCGPLRDRAAIEGFVQCELDVARWNSEDHSSELSQLSADSVTVLGDVFAALDRKVENGELIPKHGPGSTADHVLGNAKYTVSGWTSRLDEVFPVADWVLPNHRYWEHLEGVDIHEPGEEPPVRVVLVPKTAKTPRVIALEPHFVQYAQQGIKEHLYDAVSESNLLEPLIGFENQLPNRELAEKGSRDGSLATLDLSEASDRVSDLHVGALLAHFPLAREAVAAARTPKADVPGHGIIPLSKFASMGSALCFPFEAMVFLTIVLRAVADELGEPLDRAFVCRMHGQVRVYGDDIIVPSTCAPAVVRRLEAFGLKVNQRKSFWTGKFRESCGGDYYDGRRITPVRVRSGFPTSRGDASAVVSTISLRNQLFERGFQGSVEFLDRNLVRVLGHFPEIPYQHHALGRWTYDDLPIVKVSPDLQVPMVKALMIKHALPKDSLEGYGGLLKFFLRRGDEPLSKDSFTHAGRPLSARITTRWIPLT